LSRICPRRLLPSTPLLEHLAIAGLAMVPTHKLAFRPKRGR
jgi:hypothetical protein